LRANCHSPLPLTAGVHGCVVANAHKELRDWADANMHDRWVHRFNTHDHALLPESAQI